MKRKFENIKLEVLFFDTEDIIRTSQNDNVVDLPEFDEEFNGNG